MNFIQIHGSMINPRHVRNIVSHDMRRISGVNSYQICVNFKPPLADVVFCFNDKSVRDERFEDIRKICKEE